MPTIRSLFACLACCLTFLTARATHITGAELTYTCINPATNTYQVDMTVYRDCLNGQAGFDAQVTVYIFRGSDGSVYNTRTINFNNNSVQLIPIFWNACTGAPQNQCVEYGVYSFTITLPPTVGGYDIGWARCCRNNIVTNIGIEQGITVLAHVPGSDEATGCNSMPQFNQRPPIFLCVGQQFNFDHSATDADGDSLVYTISNPYGSLNAFGQGATVNLPVVAPFNPMGPPPYQNVNYLPGFSFNDPFGSGNFSIDPQSGLLTLTPTQVGLSVFAVSVLEYRNGVLLSENKRDFQINVIQCQPQGQSPQLSSDLSTVPNSSGDTIFADPTESFCYTLNGTDPVLGDSVVLFPVSASFGIGGTAPQPYATLTTTGNNPTSGTVCWDVACGNAGDTVRLIVGARDPQDCPGYNIVYDTTYVVVGEISPPSISHTAQGTPDVDTVTIDPNQNFCYTLSASDVDAADVLDFFPLEGPFASLGGSATLSRSGTNPISGQVCWTPTCTQAGGDFLFVVEARDINRCQQGRRDTLVVRVRDLPPVGAGPGGTICEGDTLALSAFGGASYQWSPAGSLVGANTATPQALPTATNTYQVDITDAFGCVRSFPVTVNVNPLPTVGISNDTSNCPGQGVPLQASGGISYSWTPTASLSNPNVANPIASPTVPTTYVVLVTDANGCENQGQVTVTPHAAEVSADVALCLGDTALLQASGGIAYQWTPATGLSDPTVANPQAFPSATTTYTVAVTDSTGCTDDAQVTVTVNPLPSLTFGADDEVCLGDTLTLSVGGGVSYQWENDPTLLGGNQAQPQVVPIASQFYVVTATDANGCAATDSIFVMVNALPVIEAGADTVQCGDQAIGLMASGGVSYLWSPDSSLSDPAVANPLADPDTSTTYYVLGTDANGCSALDSVFVRAWYANAGPDLAVCIGDTTQLQASGAIDYQWDFSPALFNPNDPQTGVFTLTDATFYLTATDSSGCTDQDTVQLTVNPLPVTSTAGSDPYVCSGGGTVVSATGGDTYQWMPDTVFDDPTLASPTAFPTYSGQILDSTWRFYVMVTDSNGCSSLDSLDQLVRVLPIISASNDTTKCPGDTISLSATGGEQYAWTPPFSLLDADQPVARVFNDTTTTYQVKVTAIWGCADSLPVTVSVIHPDAGADTLMCAGDTIPLQASGGVSYQWTPTASLQGANTATPLAFPGDTTTYSVLVTDAFGCTDTDEVTVAVQPFPPAEAGADQALCIGDTAQLSATGGVAFQWLNPDSLSVDTLANPLAWPRQSRAYVVQVFDTLGCSALDSLRLTVNPLPLADAGPDTTTKCGEDPIQLQASGGQSYQWLNQRDLSATNIPDPLAGPDSSTTFVVMVTDSNGCVNQDSIHVLTMYARAAPNDTICLRDTVQLGGSHVGGLAVAYQWSPDSSVLGATQANPLAIPTVDTDFVVTVTDSSGCSDTALQRIRVLPLPPAEAGEDQAICLGDSLTLQGRGGLRYLWTPAEGLSVDTVAAPLAQPSTTTRYRLRVADANGCQDTASVQITVHPLPVVSAAPDTGVCVGQPVFLLATGATTYQWSPEGSLSDPAVADPIAVPTTSTTYRVLGTDDNGCVNEATVRVDTDTLPTLAVASDTAICLGQTVELRASGAFGYRWSDGSQGAVLPVAPAQHTRYWVLPLGANGCPGDTAYVAVSVEQNLPRAAFEAETVEGFVPLEVAFLNQSEYATRYFWQFGDDSTATERSPLHRYEQPGDYEVILTVDNEIGCPSEARYRFIRVLDFTLFIPNIFSPNNDGNNDRFRFVMNAMEQVEIAIYDRWGRVLVRSNQTDFGWDGRDAQGRPVQEGVYTYVLRAVSYGGQELTRQGTITLVR